MPHVEGAHAGLVLSDTAYTIRRCYVLTGTGPTFAAPAAGGLIDGVSGLPTGRGAGTTTTEGWAALRGIPVRVEASAAFSAGASLVTGTDGRVATGGGTTVLRALEASGDAGSVVWAVFA